MNDPLSILPRLDVPYHFVPLHLAHAAVKLGWIPTAALEGTHHGMHAVLMYWIFCACGRPMRLPV